VKINYGLGFNMIKKIEESIMELLMDFNTLNAVTFMEITMKIKKIISMDH
jgi:hypothetical protein